MMGDEGLDKRRDRASSAQAIRAVYAKAATLERRAAARVDAARRAARDGRAQPAPRRGRRRGACCATSPTRLGEYCGEGTYAYLLDRDDDRARPTAPLVVFDTRRCPDRRAAPGDVLDHGVRHRAPSSATGRRTAAGAAAADAPRFAGRSIMLIDEAWHLVGRPQTGEYANDLARRARHLGLVLIVMSQQLSDFDTEHGLALLRTRPCRCCSPSTPNELAVHPRRAGLTDEEARLLGAAEDRQGQPRAAALDQRHAAAAAASRCASAPTEYWCFTSDQGADVPLRDAKLAEHDGDAWAAIAELARHGSQAARRPAPAR